MARDSRAPEDAVTLAELIARRDYGRAIERLRAQVQRQPLSPQTQLQLADALVLAGRGAEAVPIFIRLGDTFAAEGFFAKAIAVLKRVEKIAPGHAEARQKAASYVEKQRSAKDGAAVPARPPAAPASFEFGMEEVGVATLTRLRASEVRERIEQIVAEVGRNQPEADDPEPPPEAMATAEFRAHVLDLVQEIAPPVSPEPEETVPAPAAPRRPAAAFESAALFAEMSAEEVTALVDELGLLRVETGDIIVTEGEAGGSLFVIGQGEVKVFARTPEGRSVPVGELRSGDFFGEISTISGRPRSATVVAASGCDLLCLDRPRMEVLAAARPHLRDILEDFFAQRAANPLAAAVRALPAEGHRAPERAAEILESYFGEAQWNPKMRLRLAHVLARSGKQADAVSILCALAEDTARAGYPAKAIALLKKAETLPAGPERSPEDTLTPAPWGEWTLRPQAEDTKEALGSWLLELAREAASRPDAQASSATAPRGYGGGLQASPLFEGLEDAERLAFVDVLRLRTAQPGDVLVTEGEPGDSVFVVAAGRVKVFVRNAVGGNDQRCQLEEGAFFGEIAALSGCVRTATVVAAARCELLELTSGALSEVTRRFPRVLEVLERFYMERTMRIEEP